MKTKMKPFVLPDRWREEARTAGHPPELVALLGRVVEAEGYTTRSGRMKGLAIRGVRGELLAVRRDIRGRPFVLLCALGSRGTTCWPLRHVPAVRRVLEEALATKLTRAQAAQRGSR